MTVAFELNKTRSEVLDMSVEDYEYALAYLRHAEDERKRAQRKQRLKQMGRK